MRNLSVVRLPFFASDRASKRQELARVHALDLLYRERALDVARIHVRIYFRLSMPDDQR